jgi:putative ABC transport system substrate-binding protein
MTCMGERSFRTVVFTAFAVATVVFALTAASQQPKAARLGMLCQALCEGPGYRAFDDELQKLGWFEGQNLSVDRRAAVGRYELLSQLAEQLVRTKPDLIIAAGTDSALAASHATADIPLVFSFVVDPVQKRLVDSLARPGGNATGVTAMEPGSFLEKQLDLLKELLPTARRVALIVNGRSASPRFVSGEAPHAAARRGMQIDPVAITDIEELTNAIEGAKARGADAFLIIPDPIFNNPSNRIPDIMARVAVPALYGLRQAAEAGGLVSYGSDLVAIARRHAHFVDRVLRGARPSDLPVEQPTKYEMVINLQTAKALGLAIPPALLARADDIIE